MIHLYLSLTLYNASQILDFSCLFYEVTLYLWNAFSFFCYSNNVRQDLFHAVLVYVWRWNTDPYQCSHRQSSESTLVEVEGQLVIYLDPLQKKVVKNIVWFLCFTFVAVENICKCRCILLIISYLFVIHVQIHFQRTTLEPSQNLQSWFSTLKKIKSTKLFFYTCRYFCSYVRINMK